MKNCVWVKPEMVVQIEFGERTPDGHLRYSGFIGLREDKRTRELCKKQRFIEQFGLDGVVNQLRVIL